MKASCVCTNLNKVFTDLLIRIIYVFYSTLSRLLLAADLYSTDLFPAVLKMYDVELYKVIPTIINTKLSYL